MKGTFRPERLPQSSSAACAVHHERRVFTQLREWVLLDAYLTIGPYGWELIKEDDYYPVYNADPVAPPAPKFDFL